MSSASIVGYDRSIERNPKHGIFPTQPGRLTFENVAAAKTAMMSDPQKALDGALAALAQIRDLPPSPQKRTAEITGTWLQSEALFRLDQAPKALPTSD